MRLFELTSPAVDRLRHQRALALLPIGSVEQHSDHLPVGTDSLIVQAIASALERRRPETVLLLPLVWVGASSHHLAFPGTLSVATEALVRYLTGIIVSLHRSSGLERFFILNGHGGNEPAMRVVLEHVREVLPSVRAFAASYWYALFDAMSDAGVARGEAMGHACHVETSLMHAIHPELVDTTLVEPSWRVGHQEEWLHESAGFDTITERGGIGDPTRADASQGQAMLDLATERLAELADRLIEG